jgi:hypothetical protein
MVWIANTDADSAVPADWLQTHLRFASTGVDLLRGMVQPNPADVPGQLLLDWHDRHELVDGHRHVHGANMGIRGGMYLAVGGFPDVASDEDVLLANATRRVDGRVMSTRASPVETSARLSGRTPGGMAGYLGELAGPPRRGRPYPVSHPASPSHDDAPCRDADQEMTASTTFFNALG